MNHPIPDDALDDRLGLVGRSGSGKSYNAGGAVERVLERRGRVVIIDPLGVWYGLRLLADGKTPPRTTSSSSADRMATSRSRSMPAR
jgi:uncharacterized protein